MDNLHILKNNLQKAKTELEQYIRSKAELFREQVRALTWTKNCVAHVVFNVDVGEREYFPYVLMISNGFPEIDLERVDVTLEGFPQEENVYHDNPYITYRFINRLGNKKAFVFTDSLKQMVDFLKQTKFERVVLPYDKLEILTAAKEMEKR